MASDPQLPAPPPRAAHPQDAPMSFEPADAFLIEDAETWEVLADPLRIEILESCARPRSVGEIAEAMNVPRTRLYHHVNLMEEKGILAIAATRQKGAMTEKLYQASAKSFRPSDEFIHSASPRQRGEAITSSLLPAAQADFLRALEDERFTLGPDDQATRVSLGRRLLRLTPERLAELVAELDALFERYGGSDDTPEAIPVAVLHMVHPSSRVMP